MKKIVNVVIYYANEYEILEYASLLSKQSIAYEIILVIVVNKIGDMGLENFSDKLSEIEIETLIFNPNENLGYLNGLIYGYNQYCKTIKDIPLWVVMSNTDIQFSNERFFEDFLNTVYKDNVWCVAPSVYSCAKNSYDNPQYIKRFTITELNKKIFIFEKPILAYFYMKLAIIKAKLTRKKKKNSQYVYSAHGCFFIIRREFAEIIKDKKYAAFLYNEETFIAEICRTYGKKCFYDNTIEVNHFESSITSKLDIKNKSKYFADSLKVVRDEYFC